jgi:hypothetical protein
MAMGVVFWKGESWKVAKPITIVQLKMEDAYIFCNVIGFFLMKKNNQDKKGRPSSLFKLQKTLT